ncbi:hypothetical protein [Burkholderia ambifaria]|uniref:hypothetical protein n=1 Tax=Burkholderia ambifaria TaxID=152480 RepID=UPI00158FD25B|nr:hypothetical protein [Burkholderia ambifaria]
MLNTFLEGLAATLIATSATHAARYAHVPIESSQDLGMQDVARLLALPVHQHNEDSERRLCDIGEHPALTREHLDEHARDTQRHEPGTIAITLLSAVHSDVFCRVAITPILEHLYVHSDVFCRLVNHYRQCGGPPFQVQRSLLGTDMQRAHAEPTACTDGAPPILYVTLNALNEAVGTPEASPRRELVRQLVGYLMCASAHEPDEAGIEQYTDLIVGDGPEAEPLRPAVTDPHLRAVAQPSPAPGADSLCPAVLGATPPVALAGEPPRMDNRMAMTAVVPLGAPLSPLVQFPQWPRDRMATTSAASLFDAASTPEQPTTILSSATQPASITPADEESLLPLPESIDPDEFVRLCSPGIIETMMNVADDLDIVHDCANWPGSDVPSCPGLNPDGEGQVGMNRSHPHGTATWRHLLATHPAVLESPPPRTGHEHPIDVIDLTGDPTDGAEATCAAMDAAVAHGAPMPAAVPRGEITVPSTSPMPDAPAPTNRQVWYAARDPLQRQSWGSRWGHTLRRSSGEGGANAQDRQDGLPAVYGPTRGFRHLSAPPPMPQQSHSLMQAPAPHSAEQPLMRPPEGTAPRTLLQSSSPSAVTQPVAAVRSIDATDPFVGFDDVRTNRLAFIARQYKHYIAERNGSIEIRSQYLQSRVVSCLTPDTLSLVHYRHQPSERPEPVEETVLFQWRALQLAVGTQHLPSAIVVYPPPRPNAQPAARVDPDTLPRWMGQLLWRDRWGSVLARLMEALQLEMTQVGMLEVDNTIRIDVKALTAAPDTARRNDRGAIAVSGFGRLDRSGGRAGSPDISSSGSGDRPAMSVRPAGADSGYPPDEASAAPSAVRTPTMRRLNDVLIAMKRFSDARAKRDMHPPAHDMDAKRQRR